jgi:uncharacterized membrane protein YfcA
MQWGEIVAMMLATLVGLSLGALGSGGSIITIPLLVYVAGVPADKAVGMSLVIVGTTSLMGAVLHMRNGNVAWKPSLLFALTGTVGAYLGAYGTHLVSSRGLMLLFAVIMMIVGIRMWQTTGKAQKCGTFNAARCLSIGFAVGLLTGFLGIGGGFLIVPALVLFAGLDSRMAAGTSLAVIVLNSVTGIIGHLRFESFDWRLLGGFLTFALGGMVLGTMVANSLAEYRLRRLFACTVLILAVGVGVVNLLP